MEIVSRDNSREGERQGSWRGRAGQGKFCAIIINFSVFKSLQKNNKNNSECKVWIWGVSLSLSFVTHVPLW